MKTTHPFDSGNVAIYMARVATQEYVEDQAEQGKLLEVAKDERCAVAFLASTSLQKYVISGEIRMAMIERWIAEAVASASIPSDQQNTLTGQVVYQIWCDVQSHHAPPWSDIPEQHTSFDELAAALMDHLHLCHSCGRHPEDGYLAEIAGMMICTACRQPPRK